MLLAAMVALLVWKLTSQAWHVYLLAVLVCLLIATLVYLARYIIHDRAEVALSPSRSEFHWPSGWTVAEYCRALLTYLKMSSWRVQSAESAGADRLYLGLQRERHRITLMCLRPGIAASEDDLASLESMRQRAGTLVAVLVTDRPFRHQPRSTEAAAAEAAAERSDTQPQTLVISYAALDNLADELEGGNEEQRRALAARALEDAEPDDAEEEAF